MSKSLFEQQAEQLIAELSLIINEKWPLLNNTGHLCLKNLFDSYSRMQNNDTDDIDLKTEISIDSDKISALNDCNQIYEKLRDQIKNFEFYKNRLDTIKTNLINLIDIKIEYLLNPTCDLEGFKTSLVDVTECFSKEFELKLALFEQFLFKSRLSTDTQTTLLSMWVNQPYLDEYLIFKFVSFLKFYFLNSNNNNKKKLINESAIRGV